MQTDANRMVTFCHFLSTRPDASLPSHCILHVAQGQGPLTPWHQIMVGGWATLLRNMSSCIGMMNFLRFMEPKKIMLL